MGLFKGKKTPTQTYTTADLGLPTVEVFATEMLSRAGLEQSEIRRISEKYPTATPPNPSHTFSMGDSPNPWTLACLTAEQIIWDALNAYIVSQNLAGRDAAMATYISEGLIGLATIVMKGNAHSRDLARDVMTDYIYGTFEKPDHSLWSLVDGYVKDYWIPGVGQRPT